MPEWVELVCESTDGVHRYRVTGELMQGGQAHVYQGHGRASEGEGRVTLRVFRPVEPTTADLAHYTREEFAAKARRSWSNGDAVLQMLNQRGVPNICRWANSFIGYPPHRPGEPGTGEPVPVQVLDYIEGHNLYRRLTDRYLEEHAGEDDLDGLRLLRGLADTLRALDALDHVVHQDIKPANVIIRPDGSLVLIDFTSARREADLTHMAYTPGASGPEVERREKPTPAYDVHGFGAVAYYLLVRADPRRDGGLNIVPAIAGRPALLDHLRLVLHDEPAQRLRRDELHDWIDRLAVLIGRTGLVSPGVRWDGPAVRDEPITVPSPSPAATAAERFPFRAITDLREALVVRAAVAAAPGAGLSLLTLPRPPAEWLTSNPADAEAPDAERAPGPWQGVWSPAPPSHPAAPSGPAGAGTAVPQPSTLTDAVPPGSPSRARFDPDLVRRLAFGGEFTGIGAGAAFLAWLVWLLAGGAQDHLTEIAELVTMLVVAAALVGLAKAGGAALERRWPPLRDSIVFHRALHAPATLLFAGATVLYAWLILG